MTSIISIFLAVGVLHQQLIFTNIAGEEHPQRRKLHAQQRGKGRNSRKVTGVFIK